MTQPRRISAILGLLAGFWAFTAAAAPRAIVVNAAEVTGAIRPMNGVNNGPLSQQGLVDVSDYYRRLRVPFVRLSDTRFSYYDDVFGVDDVFPNPAADPADPANYDFALSDRYMSATAPTTPQLMYRLGYQVDINRPASRRHVDPPASFETFAEISGRILQHYNLGWAAGDRRRIEYWEIWNEPDIKSAEAFRPGLEPFVFWTGTPEAYFRLYELTARKLKALDPSVKVGGPALAGDTKFLEAMLRYCRDHDVPLDFVSWHLYLQDAEIVLPYSREIRRLMDKYGYHDAESIMDEWNYGPVATRRPDPSNWQRAFVDPTFATSYFDATHNEVGAAFSAGMLIHLQDAPVDVAAYWDGTANPRWGLFSPFGVPYKTYYAFQAFTDLLTAPQRLQLRTSGLEDVVAVASVAADNKVVRVLISRTGQPKASLPVQIDSLPWAGGRYEIQVVDRTRDLAVTASGFFGGSRASLQIPIDGPSVILVTLRPAG